MPTLMLGRSVVALFQVQLLLLQSLHISAVTINHWILQDDGRITQKVDSPFLLREPHNLVAFLDQIQHNDYVEQSYLKLRRQRELIAEHLRYSKQFSEDLVLQAERLQPHLGAQTQPMQNLINSLEALTKQTAKMYRIYIRSYLEFVKDELKEFRKLKTKITQHHEKLIQQQVPLAVRHLDEKATNDNYLKRGQYCSTRTLSISEEPILFCDFYSDMQMRLDGKDVDPETLERDWQLTSESVLNQVTNLNVQQRMNLEQIKAMRAKKAAAMASAKSKKVTTQVSSATGEIPDAKSNDT
uniref:Tetratricopeptide repeat protein 17 n=1 Tax=Zeugodacus cucurbitae TaxID=28588 RepID=A0A0A1WQZ9_ZEUCU